MRQQSKIHAGRRFFLGASALCLGAAALPAQAQAPYPSQPIKLVVGFAPGGPTDVQARLFARKLAPLLGQTVVVENKPGASTTIAVTEVARAAPDGYTLYFGGSGAYATTPLTIPQLQYDPRSSFAPIAMIGEEQIAFAVHPGVPARTMAELADQVKANPGKYSFASSGHGNITHLTGELFKQKAGGLDLIHVAYKGAAPAVNDVVAGHLGVVVGGLGSVYPLHKDGKLRVLAITSENRASYAPDIPTAAESGVKDLISASTLVLLAPAKTPAAVVERLDSAVAQALAEPSYQQEMRQSNVEPITGSTPAKTDALLKRELDQWANLVKASGISLNQ